MEKAFANHQMAPASYDEPKCPCCNGVLTIVDTSRTKLPPLIDFLVPKTLTRRGARPVQRQDPAVGGGQAVRASRRLHLPHERHSHHP
jgi:hypothetical protein